jgi:hypothetical protein
MDRINHLKMVTPDPGAVDRFLREVVNIPEGWRLGSTDQSPTGGEVRSPARDADGNFTVDSVHGFRGAGGMEGGLIIGSPDSRQFQVLQGPVPHIWGVAIGTRDVEGAHERCVALGFPCTDPAVMAWGAGAIRFFFAEAGGIVFEVMRAEPASQ